MANIVLVRPPFLQDVRARISHYGVPSIGVAYLAGALLKQGHNVKCIDAFGESPEIFRPFGGKNLRIRGLNKEEIAERIPADTEIIGVSCMFSNEWLYTREVIRTLRIKFPRAFLIAGGEHITAEPELSLRDCPGLNAVVLGEGEETLVELVRVWGEGGPISEVNGIAYLEADSMVRTKPRARIANIDEIPQPAWETMPLENYLSKGLGYGLQGKRSMPMLASRGCPYRCTFCSNPSMWTPKWKDRDVELVIKELKRYKEIYQIEHFDFFDLTAIVQEKWTKQFCTRLIEENLGLTWALPSGTRSEALSAEVLSLLKQSGCKKIYYAPESGSKETLLRIKKRVNLERMISSMKHAVREGLITRANIIMGFPNQTKKEVLENFWFVFKLAIIGVNDIVCCAFSPYPGSELHEQLKREGKLDTKGEKYILFLSGNVANVSSHAQSWNEHFTPRQIFLLIWSLTGLFYGTQFLLRPWRFVTAVYRMATGKPFTTFEIITLDMLRDLFTQRKRVPAVVAIPQET